MTPISGMLFRFDHDGHSLDLFEITPAIPVTGSIWCRDCDQRWEATEDEIRDTTMAAWFAVTQLPGRPIRTNARGQSVIGHG